MGGSFKIFLAQRKTTQEKKLKWGFKILIGAQFAGTLLALMEQEGAIFCLTPTWSYHVYSRREPIAKKEAPQHLGATREKFVNIETH